MLRYGIPAYRLLLDCSEQEIDQIRVLGDTESTPARPLPAWRPSARITMLCSSASASDVSRLIPIEAFHQSFVLGGLKIFLHCRRPQRAAAGRALDRGLWSSAAAMSPSTSLLTAFGGRAPSRSPASSLEKRRHTCRAS